MKNYCEGDGDRVMENIGELGESARRLVLNGRENCCRLYPRPIDEANRESTYGLTPDAGDMLLTLERLELVSENGTLLCRESSAVLKPPVLIDGSCRIE